MPADAAAPLRILMVANGYPPSAVGGVEVHTQQVVRELARRGHQAAVFCRERAPHLADYHILRESREGVAVVRVVNDFKQAAAFRSLYGDPRIDAIFGSLLDEFRPDVVHFNHFLALSADLPHETARRKIPALATLHDYWAVCQRVNLLNARQEMCPGPLAGGDCYRCLFVEVGNRGPAVGWLKRVLPYRLRVWLRRAVRLDAGSLHLPAERADMALRLRTFQKALGTVQGLRVPSQFVRGVLANNGLPGGRIQVVPLEVEFVPQPRRPAAGLIRFGYAGAITPSKGVESLLLAFRSVDAGSIRLSIHGREDIEPAFAERMRALAGGDPRITFHGPFSPDERGAVYAGMDVLVVPSLWHETYSLVAREALLAGVPVIAARAGALAEIIQDGVNGFLFPPGSSAALAAHIAQIARVPAILKQMNPAGSIPFVSITDFVDQLVNNYRLVINS